MVIQRPQLKALLWVLIALFVPTAAGMAVIDAGLRVPASPAGIVSFQFCAFLSSCDATLEQWGVAGQRLAMLSLGLDYLFMAVYAALLCVALLLMVERVPDRLQRPTVVLAWVAVSAGIADALENFFFIRVVLDGTGASCAAIAGTLAAIKFALLGVALAWLAIVLLAYGRRTG